MGLFDFFGSSASSQSAGTAKELVSQGALLLDVRTPAEFSTGHVSGAKNIPVQELATRMSELPPKPRAIVVYCKSGGRSAAAASLLKNAGYQVHDLGAMSNWQP
jgi:rhodanese-related sulfurtransferase